MTKKRKQAPAKPPMKPARAAKLASIASDRARGWTLNQIAIHYGVSLTTAHRLASHIPIMLPNRWHRARLPKQAPTPYLFDVHRLQAGWSAGA